MVGGGARAVMLYLVQIGSASASRSPATSTRATARPSTRPAPRASRRSPIAAADPRRYRGGRARALILRIAALASRASLLTLPLNSGRRPRGGGPAATLDELRRRGARAATQDRTDQAARPGGLRGHAQGRAAGRRVPRHAHRRGQARRADREASTGWCSSSRMDHDAMPATLMYRGYRKSTCTSINHVVCHGIPSDKPLQGRRHRQCRRDADPRRLARRLQPHVSRSARSRAAPSG